MQENQKNGAVFFAVFRIVILLEENRILSPQEQLF